MPVGLFHATIVLKTQVVWTSMTPTRIFVLVLLLTFAVEGTIMLLLPSMPSWVRTSAVVGIVDASLLTLVMAPAIWWLVVKPLRRLSESRGHLLHLLFDAQERERARISRDLHDEVGQQLTALLLGIGTIESAEDLATAHTVAHDLRAIGAGAHEEVRRLARGLRPGVLKELGLATAIERLCEDFERNHAVTVRLVAPPAACAGLSRPVETSLYRILQESLTNVGRHSAANSVDVTLAKDPSAVTLSIRDDGRGISEEASEGLSSGGQSMGLDSIRERAQMLQGECQIDSPQAGGTRVRVRIPVS
jgi:signal transduction histidine kinase